MVMVTSCRVWPGAVAEVPGRPHAQYTLVLPYLAYLARVLGGPAAKELRRWIVGAGDAARTAGVGVVGVCWKGPSWLPRCSAPGNRPPDPATRAGEAANERPLAQRAFTPGSLAATIQSRTSPVSIGIDHRELPSLQIGDNNVTGFETTAGALRIQSEPCQRGGTDGRREPRRASRERKHPARPSRASLPRLSPRLPLCFLQILAIMRR